MMTTTLNSEREENLKRIDSNVIQVITPFFSIELINDELRETVMMKTE